MKKKCSHCGNKKPLEAFHRDAHTNDGRRYECKACRNPVVRKQMQRYGQRPEVKARRRAYYYDPVRYEQILDYQANYRYQKKLREILHVGA